MGDTLVRLRADGSSLLCLGLDGRAGCRSGSSSAHGEKEEKEEVLTVDELAVVVDEGLDEALLGEVADGDAGEGTVDLHPVDEDRLGDHLEGGDLLHLQRGRRISFRGLTRVG